MSHLLKNNFNIHYITFGRIRFHHADIRASARNDYPRSFSVSSLSSSTGFDILGSATPEN